MTYRDQIRFTLVGVLFCSVLAGAGLAAPVPETLEEHPWYDKTRDNYKQYTAEEVRKFIPDKKNPPEYAPGSPPLLPAGLAQVLLIIFLGVLVFFSVFLAYRWFRERESGSRSGTRLSGQAGPEVLELPGLEKSIELNQSDLPGLIRRALDAGRDRLAASYIFAYLLFELSNREYITLAKNRTAREYARIMAVEERVPSLFRELFRQAAANFDVAVYRESSPGVDLREFWEKVQAALRALSSGNVA